MAHVLELVVDRLDESPFPEDDFVIQAHEGVLHVLLESRDKVYAVNEKALEKFLAYIAPVCEDLSEQVLLESVVFQRLSVVHVPRRERPLYYLSAVVDHDVQFESVEPSHRAFADGRPSPHCPVAAGALDVARGQRGGVDDRHARAFAQSACLEE